MIDNEILLTCSVIWKKFYFTAKLATLFALASYLSHCKYGKSFCRYKAVICSKSGVHLTGYSFLSCPQARKMCNKSCILNSTRRQYFKVDSHIYLVRVVTASSLATALSYLFNLFICLACFLFICSSEKKKGKNIKSCRLSSFAVIRIVLLPRFLKWSF